MKLTIGIVPIALLVACGGGGGGTTAPADAAVSPDSLSIPDATSESGGATRGGSDATTTATGCDHVVAMCTKLNQCAPFFLKAIYGDLASCNDRLIKVCTQQSATNTTGLSQASVQACETALNAATCADLFANNIPACSFHGTLADGATCGDNTQCASAFCQLGGNLCGTCAAKAAAGAACASGNNDECQAGLVCSSNKTCVAPALLGAACDDKTQPCLTGTFCTTAKTCASTVAVGTDCPGAYMNFADGTYCAAKNTTASPQVGTQIGTASAGQPCGLAPGNSLPATLCAPGSVAACTLTSGGITLFGLPTKGVCSAPIQDGFTCAATDVCLAGAQCISGICQIPAGRYCQ